MTTSNNTPTPTAPSSNNIVAIIPACNEAGWVRDVRGVRSFVGRVQVVDDGSTDGTGN